MFEAVVGGASAWLTAEYLPALAGEGALEEATVCR